MSEQYLIPARRVRQAKTLPHGRNRDFEALRLRTQYWSLDAIAERLGLSSREHAARCIKRAASNMIRFAGDEQRLLEQQSLDELEAVLWQELREKYALVQHGRVIFDEDQEAVEDRRFRLEVVDRIMRIKDRRAKLLGLDAPTRAEVITVDSIDDEIRKLETELARGKPA